VLRDFVGEGILTVPIRDPNLEDVEANRVGERVKVVPRTSILQGAGAGDENSRDAGRRVPTNLAFDDESTFVNVVTGLAARDGTELNASTPSAKVNLDVDGVDETIRCAVALPVISEGGPHVSIRKQSADALTPVDLIDRGRSLPIWSPCCGCCTSTAGRPLRRADRRGENDPAQRSHPFIPFDDRPVSIDEGLARSGSRTRPGCRSRRATTRTRTRP